MVDYLRFDSGLDPFGRLEKCAVDCSFCIFYCFVTILGPNKKQQDAQVPSVNKGMLLGTTP